MPDVAFDSERHAQVSDDMSARGGGELTTSAMSATLLAAAQLFGHWTTESAAQVMGEAVRSFLSSFATNMTNEAQFLNDLDTKVCPGRLRLYRHRGRCPCCDGAVGLRCSP